MRSGNVAGSPSATAPTSAASSSCRHATKRRRSRSPGVAQLRLLLVEPSARGLGLGETLVRECERFARQAGYRKIKLWTQSLLLAARSIYQKSGYRLVATEPHHSFGHDLVGETWELPLQ